jgi:hypothetical protein
MERLLLKGKRDATHLPEFDILEFWICIDVKICLIRNFFIIIIIIINLKLMKLRQNRSDQRE